MRHLIALFVFFLILGSGCTREPTEQVQIPTAAVLPTITPLPPTDIPTESPTDTPPTLTPTFTVSPAHTDTPTQMPTEVPRLTATVDIGGWNVTEETSLIDDTTTILVVRPSDTEVRTWLSTAIPLLALRCQAGSFDVLIHAGATFDSDTVYEDRVFVHVRWDREVAEVVQMDQVSDEIVSFTDPRGILQELLTHQVLTFGFQPFNTGEQVTTFTLAGLRDVIQPLLSACDLPSA